MLCSCVALCGAVVLSVCLSVCCCSCCCRLLLVRLTGVTFLPRRSPHTTQCNRQRGGKAARATPDLHAHFNLHHLAPVTLHLSTALALIVVLRVVPLLFCLTLPLCLCAMASSPLLWMGCVAVALFPPLFGCVVALLLSSAHSSFLLLLAGLSWSVQLCGWVWSASHHSEKYYDAIGSLTFVLLILTSLFHALTASSSWSYPSFLTSLLPGLLSASPARTASVWDQVNSLNVRQLVNSVLVLVWCIRLGTHLYNRIQRDQKDSRFDSMRDSGAKLLLPWSTQGLWVFLLSLPVTLTNALLTADAGGQYDKTALHSLTWRDYVGWLLWALMWGVEVTADRQKAAFAANKENAEKKRFIHSGLWSYSRHPNCTQHTHSTHTHRVVARARYTSHLLVYSVSPPLCPHLCSLWNVRLAVWLSVLWPLCSALCADLGEMSLWFGLFLSCSSAFSRSSHYLSIAGPCFNAFLLLFVSGVPLLEKNSDKKSTRRSSRTPPLPLSTRGRLLTSLCSTWLAVRFGSDPRYQRYKRDTPVLVPNISQLLSKAKS